MQKMLDSGFIQAIKMVSTKSDSTPTPKSAPRKRVAVATGPIDSPMGVIEPGQVAGREIPLGGARRRRAGRAGHRQLADG